jgi:hypothetical protein
MNASRSFGSPRRPFFLERQQRLRVGEAGGEETAAGALPAPDSP